MMFSSISTGKSDKKANNNGAGVDMVDSSTGSGYCIQRPEEEAVMLLKNDEQRLPNSNKRNDKQTNGDANVTFDKHRNNCDNLRKKTATSDDNIGGVNSNDGDDNTAPQKFNDDLFSDDEDPYAELQSYLDKVKVSTPFLVTFVHNFMLENTKDDVNISTLKQTFISS